MLDIYYHSVGRNASLLINFPVDTRGLIHEKDAEQILKLGDAIKSDFARNLLVGKKVSATNTRGNSKKYKAENLIDNNPETYWATNDKVLSASITFEFGEETEFNRFLVQEDIRLGQRIKSFTLEAKLGDSWKEIASQTTVGRKRILRFPNITASQLRLNILDAKACPAISNVGVYLAPKVIVEPGIVRDKNGLVTMGNYDSGLEIYYTLNGDTPSLQSSKYTEPFLLNEKTILKALTADPNSGKMSEVKTINFDISKTRWVMAGEYKSLEQTKSVFDGDPNTSWTLKKSVPVDFIIDLGEKLKLSGFTYLPNQSRGNPGIIFNYEFYVSTDGRNWGKPVSKGEFPNIKNSPVLQEKKFNTVSGRFVKFCALSTIEEDGRIGIAEFGITTE